jgi:hypothetical protein
MALSTEARNRIEDALNRASFGRACFGRGRFLNLSYFTKDFASQIFSGMEKTEAFEREVSNKLLSSNIAYFLYKL